MLGAQRCDEAAHATREEPYAVWDVSGGCLRRQQQQRQNSTQTSSKATKQTKRGGKIAANNEDGRNETQTDQEGGGGGSAQEGERQLRPLPSPPVATRPSRKCPDRRGVRGCTRADKARRNRILSEKVGNEPAKKTTRATQRSETRLEQRGGSLRRCRRCVDDVRSMRHQRVHRAAGVTLGKET